MIRWPFHRGHEDRARAERDVDDELAFHFAQTTRDLEISGLAPDEARQVADRRFGPRRPHRSRLVRMQVARIASDNRRAAMHVLISSLRSVGRGVARSPGFTFGVIAILTLGLGVNAITFSLVDRLVLRGPAGITAPEALRRVVIHRRSRSGASAAVTDLA